MYAIDFDSEKTSSFHPDAPTREATEIDQVFLSKIISQRSAILFNPDWQTWGKLAIKAVVPTLLAVSSASATSNKQPISNSDGAAHEIVQPERWFYPDVYSYVGWSKLAEFMDSLMRSGEISRETKDEIWRLLQTVFCYFGGKLHTPVVHPGDEEHLLMTWDLYPHHLEIEYMEEAEVSAYYNNAETNEDFEVNFKRGGEVPGAVTSFLRLFRS